MPGPARRMPVLGRIAVRPHSSEVPGSASSDRSDVLPLMFQWHGCCDDSEYRPYERAERETAIHLSLVISLKTLICLEAGAASDTFSQRKRG